MKILIIGSMAFIHDMVAIQKKLQVAGHEVNIPYGIEPHLADPRYTDNLEDNLEFCIKNNIMKRNFDEVVAHDAVLVLNNPRNGIDGYIGASVLMELGIAHHNNKKIFLLNAYPDFNKFRWAHELAIIQPTVIDGDLTKIK